MDCLFIYIAIVCQRRFKHSVLYTACAMLVIAITGLILLLVIPVNQAKLAGLYLCISYIASLTMVMTSISNNVSGYTKKIFYNCSMVFLCAIGNFVGPQLMIPSQSPLYVGGMMTYLVSNVISIALLLVARYSMSKLNKKNELNRKIDHVIDKSIDITDRQDNQFIYKL